MRNGKRLREAFWQDCETDEERSTFMASGRAYVTGLIDKSIQHEVAMAFHFRSEIMKDRLKGGE